MDFAAKRLDPKLVGTSKNLFFRRAVCVALFVLSACSSQETEKPSPAAPATVVRQLSTDDIWHAQLRSVVNTLAFTGTLNAVSQSTVAANLKGVVLAVRVNAGDSVKKGQILAKIDDRLARETVNEERARLAHFAAQVRFKQIKLEQQRRLYQQAFISKLALDEAEQNFAMTEGELKAQQAKLNRAQKELADGTVKAPLSGVVYERKINPGELVEPNTALFSLADLSVLDITAALPAHSIPQITVGMQADFQVEGDQKKYQARIVRINPVAYAGTRSFAVYLRVDNADLSLRGGQFVQGSIILAQVNDHIALPLSALIDSDGKTWVMTIEQGKLVRRQVKVLLRSDAQNLASITGISAGQLVLRHQLIAVDAGQSVSLPRKPPFSP